MILSLALPVPFNGIRFNGISVSVVDAKRVCMYTVAARILIQPYFYLVQYCILLLL